MGKIKLNIEALDVESFAVDTSVEQGTVIGNDSWETCACPAPPPGSNYPGDSCVGSCSCPTCTCIGPTTPCRCLRCL